MEVVADKVPVVDHVNDVVRRWSGRPPAGSAFGAGSASETVTVSDPGEFASAAPWVPIAVGVLLALIVHLLKAAVRPVINALRPGSARRSSAPPRTSPAS